MPHRLAAPHTGALFLSSLLGTVAPATAQQWRAVRPPARGDVAMAYDWTHGSVIFGGTDNFSLAPLTAYSDTWTITGTSCRRQTPAISPPARTRHALAYDVTRIRTVLFGGVFPNRSFAGDTWEFDGTNWTTVTTAHVPGARADHAMAGLRVY